MVPPVGNWNLNWNSHHLNIHIRSTYIPNSRFGTQLLHGQMDFWKLPIWQVLALWHMAYIRYKDAIDSLSQHHFVAKSQSSYLHTLKKNLPQDTAIVLLDFAENYSFLIQDAMGLPPNTKTTKTLQTFATINRTMDLPFFCYQPWEEPLRWFRWYNKETGSTS